MAVLKASSSKQTLVFFNLTPIPFLVWKKTQLILLNLA